MADVNWEAFGNLVNSKRKEKGLSQAALAEETGTSQPAISLLERGSPTGANEERLSLIKSTLEISDEEIPLKEKVKVSSARKRVFISYSHRDKTYFDRLTIHLKPLEKKGLVEAWSDRRISAGDLWRKEIGKALSKAQVAVLLVSADFLASDFVVDSELPPLLEKASSEGAVIIPVIIKPCRFVREETLSKFQTINSPEEPLIGANEHESELIYDAIAERIESLILD